MYNPKEKQIKSFSITAIILALLIFVPSIILLFNMITGTAKQLQYGYSMYAFLLIILGAIPSILSIIFGILAFSKYHKNKRFLPASIKRLTLSALIISILSLVLMIADLLLDTFVF